MNRSPCTRHPLVAASLHVVSKGYCRDLQTRRGFVSCARACEVHSLPPERSQNGGYAAANPRMRKVPFFSLAPKVCEFCFRHR